MQSNSLIYIHTSSNGNFEGTLMKIVAWGSKGFKFNPKIEITRIIASITFLVETFDFITLVKSTMDQCYFNEILVRSSNNYP